MGSDGRKEWAFHPVAPEQLNDWQHLPSVRRLLLQLPASAALSGSMLASLLLDSTRRRCVDATIQLLAHPATHQHLSPDALLQQCLQCAYDHAWQHCHEWHGPMAVLAALLRHPVAAQLDSDALQRLVTAFASKQPHSPEFHPLALVLKLPVVQTLDAEALLTLVTTCVSVDVPPDGIAAALAAPAAAQWSAQQVRGLLEAAECFRNARAFSLLLQHPAAPDANDPDMQTFSGVLPTASDSDECPYVYLHRGQQQQAESDSDSEWWGDEEDAGAQAGGGG